MGPQERRNLWLFNRASAMEALAQCSTNEDIVIVLADLRDKVGQDLASVCAEKGAGIVNLAAHEKVVLDKGLIPTAIMVFERQVAVTLFTEVTPSVSQRLATKPPNSGVWVVVIAGGSSSLLETKREPLQAAGTA